MRSLLALSCSFNTLAADYLIAKVYKKIPNRNLCDLFFSRARDKLFGAHRCDAVNQSSSQPQMAFVHGNGGNPDRRAIIRQARPTEILLLQVGVCVSRLNFGK
jgi:hypothetical protein